MTCSRLVVCSLGFAFLLGTVVSLAGNPPEQSAGDLKPVTEHKAAKGAGSPASTRGLQRGSMGPDNNAAKSPAVLSVHGTGVEAIEAALNKPIDCEFVETPLKDVIDYFRDVAKIEIYLDDSGLKEAGIDPATQVTCNLHGLRFEKALNLVLDSAKLKWTIHDDVLFVTSPEKADSEVCFVNRVYDVADLVVFQDQDGKKFDDFAPLTELITSTIETKMWSDNGGTGTIDGESLGTAKCLVVSNRYDVQKKIAALLAEIRTIAGKKSGGDGLPCRERPKAAKAAATGCLGCPGMNPGPTQSKPGETPAKK